MSGILYKRYCSFKIANDSSGTGIELTYPSLTLEFESQFGIDLKSQQTKAKIYNPSDNTISFCEATRSGNAKITIDAGYLDNHGTCVIGEIVKFEHKKEKDSVLQLNIGDATKTWSESRVNYSVRNKISARSVIAAILNPLAITPAKTELGNNKIYERGITFNNVTFETAMNRIAKDTDSKFFMRNGKAYFLTPKKGYGTAILLTPETGLLSYGRANYGYKIKTLFMHLIGPASYVNLKIDAQDIDVNLKVLKGKHKFSPTGDASTEIEAEEI